MDVLHAAGQDRTHPKGHAKPLAQAITTGQTALTGADGEAAQKLAAGWADRFFRHGAKSPRGRTLRASGGRVLTR